MKEASRLPQRAQMNTESELKEVSKKICTTPHFLRTQKTEDRTRGF